MTLWDAVTTDHQDAVVTEAKEQAEAAASHAQAHAANLEATATKVNQK